MVEHQELVAQIRERFGKHRWTLMPEPHSPWQSHIPAGKHFWTQGTLAHGRCMPLDGSLRLQNFVSNFTDLESFMNMNL